ncbi:hypothetical protein Tco_0384966 [Tanacetum coccineum]
MLFPQSLLAATNALAVGEETQIDLEEDRSKNKTKNVQSFKGTMIDYDIDVEVENGWVGNLRIAAGTVKCQVNADDLFFQDARHIAKKAVDVTYMDERVSARLMQKEWLLSTRSKMECKISLIVVSRWRCREVVPPETTFRPGYRNILLEASKCNSSFFFSLEIRTPPHEVLDIVAQTFVAAIATHKNETPGSQPAAEKQTTSKDNCYHNPHP